MALTDNCDVFGSIHEDGINLILRHLRFQRPSLFNYGTSIFASNPAILCKPIEPHPEVPRRGNPLISIEDPLPIPGTGGVLGVDFCFQVTELKIDLHPGNKINLPPELSPPLAKQSLALYARVCAAIACPDQQIADEFGDQIAGQPSPAGASNEDKREENREKERPPIRTIPARQVECFCLDVFAIGYMERVGSPGNEQIAIRLKGLEIVDISPKGLENSLECYIATTLRVSILPRIRIALDTFVYELGKYATLSISATPISASVPNNPAIENDEVRVFINVGVV